MMEPLFALSEKTVEYLCGAAVACFLAWLNQRTNSNVVAGNKRTDVAVAVAADAAKKAGASEAVAATMRKEMNAKIEKVVTQTDGLAKALVASTALDEHAKGMLQGAAEERRDQGRPPLPAEHPCPPTTAHDEENGRARPPTAGGEI